LAEEGRPHWGVWDDYDIFLGDQGFAGRQFDHAMSNNQYSARPWHLPEETHVTNWTTQQMARTIRRRDPTRPGFWYLSYTHPHPPLVPPQHYWDIYQNLEVDLPTYGDWVPEAWKVADNPSGDQASSSALYRLQVQHNGWHVDTVPKIETARRAFYALCTHIDHQIRLVLGTLREEGILDNTIILFTADHGDMLGRHGMWAKRLHYEPSSNVPMILLDTKSENRLDAGSFDDRLVGLQDIMPTLLDMSGVEIPDSCNGQSMLGESRRDYFYGECNEGSMASRMIRRGSYKLIYYASGNHRQLFDLSNDPCEQHDLSGDDSNAAVLDQLTADLIGELYGSDLDWLNDSNELVGLAAEDCPPLPNRGLALQRGVHWPPAPVTPPPVGETNPGTN
jgi:arylsulfatase A-like enzyme